MAQEGGITTPELRPLGVGEILDVSIKVYTRNFWTFIGIVGLVYIPIGILAILAVLSIVPDGSFVQDGIVYYPPSESISFSFFLVVIALALLGSLLSTGVGIKAVADAYLGHKPSIGRSYAYVGRRFHSLLWLSILWVVGVGIAFILVIPGIYLAVALCVSVPALVVEGSKGTKALSRSFNLVQGTWWRTFGIVLLGFFLIPQIIQFVLTFIFEFGVEALDLSSVTGLLVLNQIVGTVATVVSAPIQVTVLTVLYFDLRVRKEGFDLQLLAERMEGPPGIGTAQQPIAAGPTSLPSSPPVSGPPTNPS